MEREYTPDGVYVYWDSATGAAQWTYDCVPTDVATVIVRQEEHHSLPPEDEPNVGDAFTGRRVTPGESVQYVIGPIFSRKTADCCWINYEFAERVHK